MGHCTSEVRRDLLLFASDGFGSAVCFALATVFHSGNSSFFQKKPLISKFGNFPTLAELISMCLLETLDQTYGCLFLRYPIGGSIGSLL